MFNREFREIQRPLLFKLVWGVRESGWIVAIAAVAAILLGWSIIAHDQLNIHQISDDELRAINLANAQNRETVARVVGHPSPAWRLPSAPKSDRLQSVDHLPAMSMQTPVAKPQPQKPKKQAALPVRASDIASAPLVQTLGIDSTEELSEFKVVPEVTLASATTEPVMPALATSFEKTAPIDTSSPDVTNQTADVAVTVLQDSSTTPEPLPSTPSASIELDNNEQPIPAKTAIDQSPSTACDPLTPITISISVIESGGVHRTCCPTHSIEPKESDITPVLFSTKENNAYKHPIGRKSNANSPSEACYTAREITLTRLRLISCPPGTIGIMSIHLTGVRLYRPYIKKDHTFCPIGRPLCPHCGHNLPP